MGAFSYWIFCSPFCQSEGKYLCNSVEFEIEVPLSSQILLSFDEIVTQISDCDFSYLLFIV
jgi:hypothetical protein